MKDRGLICALFIAVFSLSIFDVVLDTSVFDRVPTLAFQPEQMLTHIVLYLGIFLLFGIAVSRSVLKKQGTIRENEKKYRAIFEKLKQGIWVFDKDGRTKFVNPSMARMLGYTISEMLGKNFFSFLVEKNVGIVNQPEGLDLEFIRKNGSHVFGRLTATTVGGKNGLHEEMVASVIDIAEHKRMEEKLRYYSERLEDLVVEKTKNLRESEKKYRRLIENIPDISWTFDRRGNIAFIAPKIETICGYTQGEIEKEGLDFWFDKVHPDDVEHVKKAYESLFNRNQKLDIQYRVAAKGGNFVWVSDRTGTTYEKDGELYTDGVFSDITEHKRMEEMLRRSERMAVIGETAAMVGHDLRNPLQTMLGRLYLAKKLMTRWSQSHDETAIRVDLEKTFGEFERLVQYMNKIVSDLQDYARPLTPKLVATDPKMLIEDCLSTVTVPENLRVSVQIDSDIPKISVDSALMTRVLTNLITNAIQAMPSGGQLAIRISKTVETVLISIQDTGEGIPREMLNKIFTPLCTTKARGMGLGLAVSERIVKAHGGTINVESEVSKGSTFLVKLPCKTKVKDSSNGFAVGANRELLEQKLVN